MATITPYTILSSVNNNFGFISPESLNAMEESNQRELLRELTQHPTMGAFTREVMQNSGITMDTSGAVIFPEFNPPYSWTNMTLAQQWLQQQLVDPTKIVGLRVKVVCRLNGMPLARGEWSGNIKNVLKAEGMNIRNMDILVGLEDGSEYLAKLYQLEPTKKVKPKQPTKKEIAEKEKLEKEKFLQSLSADYCNRFNANIQGWKRDLKRYEVDIVSYSDTIKVTERRIKDLQLKLNKAEEKTMTSEDYLKLFYELRQHDKVEAFYITQNKNLIIFTKMLYATDRKTGNENETMPLGRFIFNIPLASSISAIRGTQLDFVCMSGSLPKFHPNIDGDRICWGNNSNDITQLLKDGNIFLLVDFTITFFSTFPHEEGANPYIDFDRWYQTRRLITPNDPDARRYFLAVVEKPYISDKLPFDPMNPPASPVGRDLVNKIDPNALHSSEDDDDWDDDWDGEETTASL